MARLKAERANMEARRERVAAMILAKTSYREIARIEGVALGTVHNDVTAIIGRWRERSAGHYADHLAEEIAKCDWLERALMAKALNGNLDVTDRLLKVMDHRAKLLGLHAPTRAKVTVVTEDVIDQAIAELERQLGSNDRT